MMYLINILEALTSVWAISELCDIKKKSSFIILTTFFSCLASYMCDLYQANSWPLLISYILIWFCMASVYVKKSYLYNFFIVLVCNYIISLSAILPLIFLYYKSAILASLAVRVIHFFLSYLFVLYRRRYSYIENKYWVPVLIIFVGCMFVLEKNIYGYFDSSFSLYTMIEIVVLFGISLTSLLFFHVIERFAEEKNRIEKNLMRERYRNISYDVIKFAKRELDYLHHGLTYRLMLIKNSLKMKDYVKSNQIVEAYLEDINKYSDITLTGNEVFDVFLIMNNAKRDFDLVKLINIPRKEFYNSIGFINLMSGVFELIEKGNTVRFSLEDKDVYCLLTLSSENMFYKKDKFKVFVKRYEHEYSSYAVNEDENLHMIKINVRVKDENNL